MKAWVKTLRDSNERGSGVFEEVSRWHRRIEHIGKWLHHLSKLFELGDGTTIVPSVIENHVPPFASMFINSSEPLLFG